MNQICIRSMCIGVVNPNSTSTLMFIYSTTDLTFGLLEQNYLIWEEFRTNNYFVVYRVVSGKK